MPSSPALLYLTKKQGNHKTSISGKIKIAFNAISLWFYATSEAAPLRTFARVTLVLQFAKHARKLAKLNVFPLQPRI
jgi:hypothetical protein